MLSAIEAEDASAAAAATSSLEPVTGDNSRLRRPVHHAVLVRRPAGARHRPDRRLAVEPTSSGRPRASSRARSRPRPTRATSITYSAAAADKLKAFQVANLDHRDRRWLLQVDCQQPGRRAVAVRALTTEQKAAATDDAMIAFLRGQHGLRERSRQRRRRTACSATAPAPLGDIVNTAPVYVKKPPFSYADTGYAAFVAAQTDREATVYVGANDGMLHAFDAETGDERWAYVPSFVCPTCTSWPTPTTRPTTASTSTGRSPSATPTTATDAGRRS